MRVSDYINEREFFIDSTETAIGTRYRAVKKGINGPERIGPWGNKLEAARELRKYMDEAKYFSTDDNQLSCFLGRILDKYDWKPSEHDFDFIIVKELKL